MDWARDHLGNLIHAREWGLSAYGLSCPTCGAPVRRRAGPERDPHFAHFSLRAKPECENYFPSTGYRPSSGSTATVAYKMRIDRGSLSCGLFLEEFDRKGALNLWLRVPSIEPSDATSGNLSIQTGLGLHFYEATALGRARLVPLLPKVPLADCKGTGDLQPLAARIVAEICSFMQDRNFFYANERGGRLVLPNEPLEWGGCYRLLSSTILDLPCQLLDSIYWKRCQMLAEWFVYEFSLPTNFKPWVPTQASDFFNKKITSSRPRLFLVDPAPHHVESDGTCIFASTPSVLLLKRSVPKKVRISGVSELVGGVITELADEWVQISRISADRRDWIVSIDDYEQLAFRVESCELYKPPGIFASCGECSWDLISEPPVGVDELRRQEVSIACPSDIVAEHIARQNPSWRHEASHLIQEADTEKVLWAGSFGHLLAVDKIATTAPEMPAKGDAADGAVLGCSIWIERVVAETFGHDGLDRVRKYLADPIRGNVHHLGTLMTSSLMPYIRAAHDRKYEG